MSNGRVAFVMALSADWLSVTLGRVCSFTLAPTKGVEGFGGVVGKMENSKP